MSQHSEYMVLQTRSNDELLPRTEYDHEEHEIAEISPRARRKLILKLDFFILPVIASVYFFASMGKSDLANAKIAGLSDELHLSPQDYSNASTILLIGYLIFQLPGTLLIKQIGPANQFAGAMTIWGVITVLTVKVRNLPGLLALRFFVGAAEAFVQGGLFYLSFWYEYRELSTRGAVFDTMSTIAGAFNGLIAYGITQGLNGVNGWLAWRWIFLIEGILPIAAAIYVWFLLPPSPEEVRFGFSAEEKRHLVQRSRNAHNSADSKLELKKIPLVMKGLHFWLHCGIACCGHFCTGSLSNFLPDILNGMVEDSVTAQYYTVIVYVCGCVGVILFSVISDKTNARGYTIVASAIGSIIGYSLLIGLTSPHARFAAACIVAFSIYPLSVLQLTWAAMGFIGYTRRGSALVFLNMFGQVFAICGTQAYSDPPYYKQGNAVALSLSGCYLIFALVLRWYYSFLNKKKREVQFSEEASFTRLKSTEELGDKHPDFFYTT